MFPFCIRIAVGNPPRRPTLYQPVFLDGSLPMALRQFTVTLSPVNPSDNVTLRTLFVSDNANPPTVTPFALTPDETTFTGGVDDTTMPGSCYLVDTNGAGDSSPSASVPLVPPPAPPPPAVPAQPSILSIVWDSPPPSARGACTPRRFR